MEVLIREILTPHDLESIFSIIKELRTHLSFSEFFDLYNLAREKNDYKVVGIFESGDCVGVMGYRILYDLVHYKHLYVDDLVVTQTKRSFGFGEKLLEFAEREAKRLDCKGLRLSTGVENSRGIKFYERLGWSARTIAYKKRILKTNSRHLAPHF